jgi:predicted ATPase with chaperone activity
VARTIANLEDSQGFGAGHLAEALQYRAYQASRAPLV